MKVIDLNSWKRKEHFEFFSSFDEPFFSLNANIECTNAYKFAADNGISFFGYYLHLSLIAVNEISEFRTRIKNDKIVIFDEIHASPTIGRKDETFGIAFVPFSKDYYLFKESLDAEKQRILNSTGIGFNSKNIRHDVIHYSSIPWVSFTGLSHPRSYKITDSVPKISFGKVFNDNDKLLMPVSILAHHGLMDGLHMGRYFERFEELLGGLD